jgi:hypothetical protein
MTYSATLFTWNPTKDPPTSFPTAYPTTAPTTYPTPYPTAYPTSEPTTYPTPYPTSYPTTEPTAYPTPYPTPYPTTEPTHYPTKYPTSQPTEHHCAVGTHYCWQDTEAAAACTALTGAEYTCECPTGYAETVAHVMHETELKHKCEKTPAPTAYPTSAPTASPTAYPTNSPTAYPTPAPTNFPTKYPTNFPTRRCHPLTASTGHWASTRIAKAARRPSMIFADSLTRFGGRMRVTLKELNAVAANTKHRTVQASYLQSEPTDGMVVRKFQRVRHRT